MVDATGAVLYLSLEDLAGSGVQVPVKSGYRVRFLGGWFSAPAAMRLRLRGSVSGCNVGGTIRVPAADTVVLPISQLGYGETQVGDGLVVDLGDGWSPDDGDSSSSSSSSGTATGEVSGQIAYQYIR